MKFFHIVCKMSINQRKVSHLLYNKINEYMLMSQVIELCYF